jgi:hypothetical protein
MSTGGVRDEWDRMFRILRFLSLAFSSSSDFKRYPELKSDVILI